MRERNERIASDDKLKSQKSTEAELQKKLARLAHMHEPGLHPSLEPARPLTEPIANVGRRFFVGRGIDHARSVAEAGQSHAEIGILCHLVRIPSADFAKCRRAKMIRRAAKRQRQSECGEFWKEDVEMRGVFRTKIACKPTRLGVCAKARLH